MTRPPPRYECWIVCGSRELADGAWVTVRLDQLAKRHGYPRVLIHGDARGADRLAKEWGERRSVLTGMEVRDRPADWDRFGKGAGPKRNREMAVEGATFQSTLLVAFPIMGLPNTGTLNMIGEGIAAGFMLVGMPYQPRAGV